jgi:hypothetical protein
MSLDKKDKPLGLKIIQFIVNNIFWYLIFSLIYFNIDCREWWLTQSVWGRASLVVLELMFFYNAFEKKDNGKS